jgi:tetratricopeptide (TPR) repeat protein
LRAGSIFGEAFTEGGVRTLLGGARATSPGVVREWLDELVELEVLARLTDERVRGETAYAFRSALVRDAAYATLPDEDRALGHTLAAEWLISVGESDASLVAEHLERGGAAAKAVEWYARAAQQARDAGDFHAVVGWAERGVACGAEGDALGALRSMQAEALNAIGETASAQTSAAEAMAALDTGSDAWHFAAAELATAAGRLSDGDALTSLVAAVHASESERTASTDARLVSRSRAAFALFSVGRHEEAEALLDEVESIGASRVDADPVIAARVHAARTTRALWRNDVEALLRLSQQAADRFEQAGDLRSACSHWVNVGFACMELGAWSRAETALVRAVADANRLGLRSLGAAARHNLGWAIAAQGRLDEACALEREAVEMCRVVGDRRLEGGSRVYLSTILLKLGDLESAEKEARSAIEIGAQVPDVRAQAQATLARVLVARDRKDEALDAARAAHDALESLGGLDEGESLVRLAWAEALMANGRDEEAKAAIARAKERLDARSRTIVDASLRESFLAVEENAKTTELALKVASGATR